MGDNDLGRVLDPSALDSAPGARAHLRIDIPSEWFHEGAELEVRAPVRLACARCEGGGCDACARSGVLRGPSDQGARIVRAVVPAGSTGAMVLRIPQPFGPASAIDQLLLEVHAAAAPSAGIVRVARAQAASPSTPIVVPWLWVAAFVTAASILASLWAR